MKGVGIWALRRCVMAPLVLILTVVAWVGLPLWGIVLGAISPMLPGRWRPLRIGWLLIVYLTIESWLLVELFGLWLLSGCGLLIRRPWFERIHYDLAQTVTWLFFREAERVAGLTIATEGPTPDAFPGRGLIVCCRHAGPADSVTLLHALMHWYRREPRVVLKDTLNWEPGVSVLLNRIPARFISPNPGSGQDFESQIRDLSTDLDHNDALVIFPEGGNFTPQRRQRAIDRLRKLGLERMAERAEGMIHVLAPRPGGVIAALDGAPDADVLLVGHTGLDHIFTAGDVWREFPMDTEIVMRWWHVPRAEIPEGREQRIEWLFEWWEHIDRWIADHPARRPTDPAGS